MTLNIQVPEIFTKSDSKMTQQVFTFEKCHILFSLKKNVQQITKHYFPVSNSENRIYLIKAVKPEDSFTYFSLQQ